MKISNLLIIRQTRVEMAKVLWYKPSQDCHHGKFTQDGMSLEPCMGMEYQKGHTFIISLSQGIFHWPKLNFISLAGGIILYILFFFPFPRACEFKALRKSFSIPSTWFLILSIVFFSSQAQGLDFGRLTRMTFESR